MLSEANTKTLAAVPGLAGEAVQALSDLQNGMRLAEGQEARLEVRRKVHT